MCSSICSNQGTLRLTWVLPLLAIVVIMMFIPQAKKEKTESKEGITSISKPFPHFEHHRIWNLVLAIPSHNFSLKSNPIWWPSSDDKFCNVNINIMSAVIHSYPCFVMQRVITKSSDVPGNLLRWGEHIFFLPSARIDVG